MTNVKRLAELVREAKEKYIYSDEIAQYLIEHGVVVPVRCKDCRHLEGKHCGLMLECIGDSFECDPDGFCDGGERKEQE